MTYKNWLGICAIENIHFRLAVALSNDKEFLGKIAQVFPNLFTNIKPEHPGPFPLSYLREIADKWCQKNGEDQSTLYNGFAMIGFPSVLWAHPENEVYDPETSIVLKMTNDDYWEYNARYREHRVCFPYINHLVVLNGTRYYTGWVNSDGVTDDACKDIYLFPADLVDIGS